MSVIVVDASALVDYLLGASGAERIRGVIAKPGTDLHAPALADVEVAAALRRAMLYGALSEERATEAVQDHLDLPLTRHGHASLLDRILALRENFTAYDACYVALVEHLGAAGLLTADERLSRAVREHTSIQILP